MASVDDMPTLKATLIEIRLDGMRWEDWFRCRQCGQHWLERYVSQGHSNVPELFKVSESQASGIESPPA